MTVKNNMYSEGMCICSPEPLMAFQVSRVAKQTIMEYFQRTRKRPTMPGLKLVTIIASASSRRIVNPVDDHVRRLIMSIRAFELSGLVTNRGRTMKWRPFGSLILSR